MGKKKNLALSKKDAKKGGDKNISLSQIFILTKIKEEWGRKGGNLISKVRFSGSDLISLYETRRYYLITIFFPIPKIM